MIQNDRNGLTDVSRSNKYCIYLSTPQILGKGAACGTDSIVSRRTEQYMETYQNTKRNKTQIIVCSQETTAISIDNYLTNTSTF